MNKVTIAGIGPGNKKYVLPIVLDKIQNSDTIIGGKRHLSLVKNLDKKVILLKSNFLEIIDYIEKYHLKEKILILVSGDSGFYSFKKFLIKELPDISFDIFCGITSLQYFFSKINLSYEKAFLSSVHGREINIIELVKKHSLIGLLTDKKYSPDKICRKLVDNNFKGIVYIGENLSYDNEKIYIGKSKKFIDKKFDSLSVIVIKGESYER